MEDNEKLRRNQKYRLGRFYNRGVKIKRKYGIKFCQLSRILKILKIVNSCLDKCRINFFSFKN